MSFAMFDVPLPVEQEEEEKPQRKKDPPLQRTNLQVKTAPPVLTSYNDYITRNSDPIMDVTFGATLRLVLIGQTGSGKSSTGDMILGEYKFTNDENKTSNILQEVTRNDGKIMIVETPGIRLTDLARDEYIVKAVSYIMTSSKLLDGEPDAFLYIVYIKNDINRELKIVDFIYRRLRKIMNKIVIVFTGYDCLHSRNISRYDYLESFPDKFKKFMKDCGCEAKTVFFENNRHLLDDQAKTQVRRLLKILK